MLKQTVSYTNFLNEQREKTLHFHINKTRLVLNLHIQNDVEKIVALTEGPERTLTTEEVLQILELVKSVMKLSYGELATDGETFRQSNDIWEQFENSAVYDEFLFSLFTNIEKAFSFILGVLPEDLRREAEKEAREQRPELFEDTNPGEVVTTVSASDITDANKDDRPAWLIAGRAPTAEEFGKATQEQKNIAYQMKMQS